MVVSKLLLRMGTVYGKFVKGRFLLLLSSLKNYVVLEAPALPSQSRCSRGRQAEWSGVAGKLKK